MSTLDDLIEEILADPLADGRSFAQQGGKVVGFIGADVPVELILAANALPVRLRGVPGVSTPHADRHLERAFGAEIRSITEQWLTGAYDFLHAVIFPRTSDSAQRLYYYLCELQRTGAIQGPRPLLYDLAKIRRESSRRHSIAATQILARELGVSEDRLAYAAQRIGKRAERIRALCSSRLHGQAPPGSWVHRLLRAASHCWSERFDSALATAATTDPAGAGRTFEHRMLLVGTAPPDERFHRAVESTGSTIVGEINAEGLCWGMLHAAAEMGESIEAIAVRQYESALGPRAFLDAASALLESVRTFRADGVIFWLIEEEEALVWELPAQVRSLDAAGIPALVLTRQRWAADAEVLAQVAHFALKPERLR